MNASPRPALPSMVRVLALVPCLVASTLGAGVGPLTKRRVEAVTSSRHAYEIAMGGTLDGHNTLTWQPVHGRNTMQRPGFEPNVELAIENVGRTAVRDPWVVVNGKPDWFSLDRVLASIVRPGMSDKEKAFAIYELYRGHFYHYNAPEGYLLNGALHSPMADPVMALNCHENSGCSLMAIGMATLWQAAGLKARVWNFATTHWVSEVLYDRAYHMLDADMDVFYVKSDNRTVASVQDCIDDRWLIKRTHCYGDFAKPDVKDDVRHGNWYLDQNTGTPYVARKGHTMGMTLRPGETIVRRWDNVGKFHDNGRHVARRPKFANGRLVYRPGLGAPTAAEFVDEAVNVRWPGKGNALTPQQPGALASLVYEVRSPWVIVGARVAATCRRRSSADRAAVLFSFNKKHWWAVWEAKKTGETKAAIDLDPYVATRSTNGRYAYFVKFEFAAARTADDVQLRDVEIVSDLEMSIPSLPALRLGKNKVEFTCASDGAVNVRVTHQWRESSANRPPQAPASPASPADGARADSLAPLLTWEPAVDPDGHKIVDHRIQVRAEKAIALSPNLERLTGSGKPEWQAPAGWLNPDTTYYWRVKAYDEKGAWSEWSPLWSFTPTGPRAPTGLAATETDGRVVLTWHPSPHGTRPARYEVHGSGRTGFIPGRSTLVAETAEPRMVLDHTDVDKWRRAYRLCAADGKGRRSAFTGNVRAPGISMAALLPRAGNLAVGAKIVPERALTAPVYKVRRDRGPGRTQDHRPHRRRHVLPQAPDPAHGF